MRRLVAIITVALAACASSADAGDVPPSEPRALSIPATICVPSADDTLWLPAAGDAVAIGARDGNYGKPCSGIRDDRWVAELVNVHGAAFRVQAAPADGHDAQVDLTVYGFVTQHWTGHTYVPGHWQELAGSRGPGVAWVAVDPADEVGSYAVVRVAARAASGATTLPVTVTVAR
jgi:hypothetical protein